MTHRFDKTAFSGTAPFRCILVAAAVLGLAGCGSASRDDASLSGQQADGTVTGPKDTGAFPNLNIAPTNAAPQFTNDQKNQKQAELKAQKAASEGSGGGINVVSEAELQKLAKNHGKDTLKQIEGKCDPKLDPTCK